MSAASLTHPRFLPILEQTALIAVLLTPVLLLHAHGIAEIAIAIADLCFLARAAVLRDWRWLRTPWLVAGVVWLGWTILCSLPIQALGLGEGGSSALLQAVLTVRFLIFVAALEHAVLRDAAPRRWLFAIIAASTLYIALQSVIQFVFGRNLYGNLPAGGDTMTGPFDRPRAGPPLARIMLPVLIPAAAGLLAMRRILPTLGAYALLFAGMCVLVLIGQRVPLVLGGLGLLVAAIMLERMRPVVLTAGVAALLVLGALSVVFPPTYQRLVGLTTVQLENFPTSHYGELFARATEIGLRNPFTGLGFDGFSTGCKQPRYFRPSFDHVQADGGGAAICWHHPHNYYLEAFANGGFVGLALFCVMVAAWLAPLARGLWANPDPLRVGLFAAVFVHLWPVQSTSAFTSMPMGGWFFLVLGWALAETRRDNEQSQG